MAFDITSAFRPGLPVAAEPWRPVPRFSFVGGHNDPDSVPAAGLAEAAVTSIGRRGRDIASYNLGGSPLGLQELRDVIADTLSTRASMACDTDQVLVTSGSLQALDLVNGLFLEPGDTVLVEEATYGGTLTRLAALAVRAVGVPLDEDGLVPGGVSETLDRLAAEGVRPKFLYTIPTVQNPTGTVLGVERRRELLAIARDRDLVVFEDDCYADLTWSGERPPALRSLDGGSDHVVYCGSYSKTIAPSIRIGFIVADGSVIAQLSALKTDGGTGALEQLALAEYAAASFDAHVDALTSALETKCDAMIDAVRSRFGDAVEVRRPEGGIYVWLRFGPEVDTTALVEPAAAAGIEFNPGAGWMTDPAAGRRHLRLCFGHLDEATIAAGVAALADVVAATTSVELPAAGGRVG